MKILYRGDCFVLARLWPTMPVAGVVRILVGVESFVPKGNVTAEID